MVFLPFSNISVDEFSQCKKNPSVKYIHFLTHMHSDHHVGMSNGWNYGRLYCSEVTANLLMQKFHDVTEVVPLEIGTRYVIEVGDKLNITVTLFDANHCPGAVMFLFEGYFGTYLYTGDIRFEKSVFEKYYELYPESYSNEEFVKCSKKIDILYLDNTFCDPVFTFPPRNQVILEIEALVEDCLREKKKVLIALDSLGKQQILTHLAYRFQTYVAVSNMKYYSLLNCRIDNHVFTKKAEQALIEVIPKREMKNRLSLDSNAVGIIPTGWCNKSFSSMGGRLWMFPYSLHSNYEELQMFMASLNVAQVQPIVRNFETAMKLSEDYGDVVKQDTIYRLSQLKQRGLPYLEQKYTTKEHTEEYQYLFDNLDYFKEISKCYTKEQKQLPPHLANSEKFRKADDIQGLIKKHDQLQTEQRNKRSRIPQQPSPADLEKQRKNQEYFDKLRVDLVRRVEEQKEELRKKGIEFKSKEQREKEKEMEKIKELEKKRKPSKSKSRSRSISKQEQQLRGQKKQKRKTQIINTKQNSRNKRKTIKVSKNLHKTIETIEIQDSSSSEQMVQHSLHQYFPLKRPHSPQQQQQLKQTKKVPLTILSQQVEQTSYVTSTTMERFLKQVIEREKKKKAERITTIYYDSVEESKSNEDSNIYKSEEENEMMRIIEMRKYRKEKKGSESN